MHEESRASQIHGDAKTGQEGDRAQQAEEVHRPVAELRDEVDGDQVEIATDETAQAELAATVFAFLMVHHLLPYVAEAVHLGDDGDVTVHLAVHLDVLHHLVAIGLEAAVEVVQLDARHPARGPVEELGRDVFHQLGVVTHLLPARYEVIAVLFDHLVEFGNLIGAVLEVGIHSDDHVAFDDLEAFVQRGRLAVVPPEAQGFHIGIGFRKALDDGPRVVGRAIVDEDDFIGKAMLVHHATDPCLQLGQRLGFIQQGDNN